MITKIYPDNPQQKEIDRVIKILQAGGVIIYPTDSVYAIGCDVTQTKAAERIARIKGTTLDKAQFSIIFQDISQLTEYTKPLNNDTFKLMKRILPGPYTFILNAGNKTPKLLIQKKKTIGIRIPENKIVLEIVKQLGNPLLTTSVKDDDEIIEYTTDPELIHERYERLVEIVIDGGYGNNVASTIIDCTGDEPLIIREGLGVEDL